jgi:hypothetical protein
MNRLTFHTAAACLISAIVCSSPAAAQTSKLVSPRPDGKLQYTPAPNGDTLPDFSNCGYMGGGVAIPDVPVKATLQPDANARDDTARLQAAIDELAKSPVDARGLRGAILLARGTYRIGGQLKITAGGIVLRGEGDGEQGGTTLIAAGKQKRSVIAVRGPAAARPNEKTAAKIITPRVPVGARTFDVQDATAFKVGDAVIVRRVGNAAWINAIGMDKIMGRPGAENTTKQWEPFDLDFERVVTAIEPSPSAGQAGSKITVDAPIVCAIEQQWGGGSLLKAADDARIQQVGIEDLRAVSEYDPAVKKQQGGRDYPADDDHADYLATLDNVKNAWIRRCTSVHMFHGVSQLNRGAKWVTVADCRSLSPVGTITGGTRYPFSHNGQLLLTIRCFSSEGRHAFVVGSRVPGPHAFVDCTSEKDHATSEPHHRWSVGGLYDNVKSRMAVQDRQWMGSGHGWAGANYVMWNCEGSVIAQTPPTANTWVIGFVGQKDKPAFDRPDATWESTGTHVQPRSLYLKQLEDRLGPDAVRNAHAGARKETR